MSLYKDCLGELASDLPGTGLRFPLVINKPGDDIFLVRTILAVDEDLQSVTFAGDMPEGYQAQFMSASFGQLVDGAESAALLTKGMQKTLCRTLWWPLAVSGAELSWAKRRKLRSSLSGSLR